MRSFAVGSAVDHSLRLHALTRSGLHCSSSCHGLHCLEVSVLHPRSRVISSECTPFVGWRTFGRHQSA
jgi:hypothetical protein